MVLKLITECQPGDILARDVTADKGIILIAKDTVINSNIIAKLTAMGIARVWIYKISENNWFDISEYRNIEENYKNSIVLIKKIVNRLSTGEKMDFKLVSTIADLVYANLDETDLIIKYLNQIRQADEYTHTHCINVSFYCMLIAKWLNFPKEKIKNAIFSGLLHDVGKLKIPSEILNKKGKLTEEEFEEIKKHPLYGYYIVNEIEDLDNEVKNVVLMHHERVDKSGYPLNAPGDLINLYTKITAIADVFDAMTSERVYKPSCTPFEAFKMFTTVGLSIFDNDILKVFINNISPYYVGSKVVLSNGEIGKISYIPPEDILNPVVSVPSGNIDFSREKELKIAKLTSGC